MALGCPIINAQGNLGGGYLTGDNGKTVHEGQPIGSGSRSVRVDGWTAEDVGMDAGDDELGRGPRGSGGERRNRLGLGWE